MEPPSKRRKVDNGSKRVNGDGKAVVEEVEDGLGVMQQQLCIVPDHSRSSWNATQSLPLLELRRRWRRWTDAASPQQREMVIKYIFEGSGVPLVATWSAWNAPRRSGPQTDTHASFVSQSILSDSVGRILLFAPLTQPAAIQQCLDCASQIALNEEDSEMDQVRQSVRAALNQLRWLDAIEDPQAMATGLSALLDSLSQDPIRKEVIESIPELVDDATSALLADDLVAQLEKGGNNVSALFDTLSSLVVTPQQQTSFRQSAIQLLSSVEADNLNAVVSFLLQHSKTEPDIAETIQSLRESIQLTEFSSHDPTTVTLFLQSLSSAHHASKSFAKIVVSTIDATNDHTEFSLLDVWLIFLLSGYSECHARLDPVLKTKIGAGVLRSPLLLRALKIQPDVLAEHFSKGVIHVAQILLSNSRAGPHFLSAAQSLYLAAFSLFKPTSVRQHILSNLLGWVGSASAPSTSSGDAATRQHHAEIALTILADIVEKYHRDVSPFTIHLHSLVDFLDAECLTSVKQIRTMYSIFTRLAYPVRAPENRDAAAFLDILLRKQLHHQEERYQRYGIIGSIELASVIGAAGQPRPLVEKARGLLETCFVSSIHRTTEARQFLFDLVDLALSNVSRMDISLISRPEGDESFALRTFVEGEFMETYLTDAACDADSSDWTLSASNEAPPFAINIYPLCNDPQRAGQLNYVGGLLRLFLRSVRIADPEGGFTSVGALLGAPIRLFSELSSSEFTNLHDGDKVTRCVALTHALNVVRELLNAFCDRPAGDESDSDSVFALFQLMMKIEETLNDFLGRTPSFSTPTRSKKSGGRLDAASAASSNQKNHLDILIQSGAVRAIDSCVARFLAHNAPPVDAGSTALFARYSRLIVDLVNDAVSVPSFASSSSIVTLTAYDRRPANVLPVFQDLAMPIGSCIQRFNEMIELGSASSVAVARVLSSIHDILGHPLFHASLKLSDNDPEHHVCFSVLKDLTAFIGTPTRILATPASCLQAFFGFLLQLSKSVASSDSPDPTLALSLMKSAQVTLECSRNLEPATDMADISELAELFLRAKWTDPPPTLLETTLRLWLQHSASPLENILFASKWLASARIQTPEEVSSELLTDKLWPLWYSTLFSCLAVQFAAAKLTSSTGISILRPSLIAFRNLCMASRDFAGQNMKRIDKPTRDNFSTLMKFGKKVVDAFVDKVGWLTDNIQAHKNDISTLITQNLQLATRQLHAVCHFAKENTDARLSKLVPPLKKSLETVVFRMREVLAAVGAASALTVGNLKFRDVKGETTSSQIPEASASEDVSDSESGSKKTKSKKAKKTKPKNKPKKNLSSQEAESDHNESE